MKKKKKSVRMERSRMSEAIGRKKKDERAERRAG